MDTRALKLFLHLSESLHFGRSSEAMHISPSALTRTIQQLEENLDARLFIRDNRSVSLTRAGKLLQVYARNNLNQWEQFRQELMSETQELQGTISIYCSVTASYSFLYDILSDFRSAHPKIAIKLRTGDAEHGIQHIRNNEEDIAIASCPDKLPNTISFKPIAASSLVLIAPLSMDATGKQWQQAPMILSEGGVIRKRIDDWFTQRGLKPDIYAEVAGNEAIVSMVSLGFGVGIVPQIVLDNSPLANRVKTVAEQPQITPIEVGLCAQKKQLRNPLVSALWDSLSSK